MSILLRSLELMVEVKAGEAGQRFGISMRSFHVTLLGVSDRLGVRRSSEPWNDLAPSCGAEACYSGMQNE